MSQPEYKRSIVSYLDILGFRNLIGDGRDPAWIEDILQRFFTSSANQQVANWFSTSEERCNHRKRGTLWLDTRAKTFSDLAVRTTTIPEDADLGFLVADEAHCISWIQAGLCYQGVLLRGAITIGDICLDEQVAFGPALIRAYELEAQAARVPRVIIDPITYSEIRQQSEVLPTPRAELCMRVVNSIFLLDADGLRFVDYIACILGNDLRHRDVSFAQAHRDLILEGLRSAAANSSTHSKYEWLRSYHNRALQGTESYVQRRTGSSVQGLSLEV